jgi:hypothetical protein
VLDSYLYINFSTHNGMDLCDFNLKLQEAWEFSLLLQFYAVFDIWTYRINHKLKHVFRQSSP